MNVAPRRPGPLEAAARALQACAEAPEPDGAAGASGNANGRRPRVRATTPPPPPPTSSAFFAEMMDLRGSVKLSLVLEKLGAPDGDAPPSSRASTSVAPWSSRGPASAPPSSRARPVVASSAARAVLEVCAARLEAVATRLDGTYREIVDGRTSLTSAPRLVKTLREVDGGADPLDRVADRAGAITWAAIQDALGIRLERARGSLQDLRAELGPRLRALGPAAARLERLDEALAEVTVEAQRGFLGRLAPATERAFVARLHGVLVAEGKTSATTTEEDAARWFARRGPLHRAVEAARLAYWGVFEHERAALEGLVTAAAALAETDPFAGEPARET